jgi:hypothetical protein
MAERGRGRGRPRDEASWTISDPGPDSVATNRSCRSCSQREPGMVRGMINEVVISSSCVASLRNPHVLENQSTRSRMIRLLPGPWCRARNSCPPVGLRRAGHSPRLGRVYRVLRGL